MKPFLAGGFPRCKSGDLSSVERFRILQKPSHHFSEELMSKNFPQRLLGQAFEKSTGHSAQIPLTSPFVLLCRVLWFSHWLTSQNKLTCASSTEQASQPAPLSGSVAWTARGESCSDYFHSSTGQPPKAPSSFLHLQDRNLNECLRK